MLSVELTNLRTKQEKWSLVSIFNHIVQNLNEKTWDKILKFPGGNSHRFSAADVHLGCPARGQQEGAGPPAQAHAAVCQWAACRSCMHLKHPPPPKRCTRSSHLQHSSPESNWRGCRSPSQSTHRTKDKKSHNFKIKTAVAKILLDKQQRIRLRKRTSCKNNLIYMINLIILWMVSYFLWFHLATMWIRTKSFSLLTTQRTKNMNLLSSTL